MTYKYYDVRRDLYESCSDKKLKGFRTWGEIKKLFKPFHWIMLIILVLLLISIIVFWLSPINSLWELLPMFIILPCTTLMEYKFDPLLDQVARKNELEKHNDAYKEYIGEIQDVLLKHGIDTDGKRQLLKEECISLLEKHESKYIFANNKVFDGLIGVPIGALISSLIYKDSDALLNEIIIVVFFGMLLVGVVKMIKRISFYSDGYLKDKQMLNALKEIEYSISKD